MTAGHVPYARLTGFGWASAIYQVVATNGYYNNYGGGGLVDPSIASCNTGDIALGGGCYITGLPQGWWPQPWISAPSGVGGWQCGFVFQAGNPAADAYWYTYVVCLHPQP